MFVLQAESDYKSPFASNYPSKCVLSSFWAEKMVQISAQFLLLFRVMTLCSPILNWTITRRLSKNVFFLQTMNGYCEITCFPTESSDLYYTQKKLKEF